MNQSNICRICGQNSELLPINRIINNYELFSCSSCKTIITNRQPALEDLEHIYNQFFVKGEYEPHRVEFERIKSGKMPPMRSRTSYMKRVEKLCSGRTLIEIGGGTGAFGVLAKNRGWDYIDYDISQVAVDFARQLSLDAHVFDMSQPPLLGSSSADLVVMWEVIEHIWDVKGYLNSIHKALRPGGVFLMSTPNYFRSSYRKSYWGAGGSPPVHQNFFTPASLKFLLSRSFNKVEIIEKRFYI